MHNRVRARHLNRLLLVVIACATVAAAAVSQLSSAAGTLGLFKGADQWWSTPLMTSVSCPTIHTCVATGNDGMIEELVGGTWHAEEPISGEIGDSTLSTEAVSCSSAGNCLVAGSGAGLNSVVASVERNGQWLPTTKLTRVSGLQIASTFPVRTACSPHGMCWAYFFARTNTNDPRMVSYAVGEQNGVWTRAFRFASNFSTSEGTLNWIIGSSCWSKASCTFLGYEYKSGDHSSPFFYVQREDNDHWDAATPVPGSSTASGFSIRTNQIACTTRGLCEIALTTPVAKGKDGGVIYREVGGRWLSPQMGLGLGRRIFTSDIESVACPSSTLCVVVGDSFFKGDVDHLFVQSETNGHWQQPVTFAVVLTPDEIVESMSVSCPTATECYVVGSTGIEPWTNGEGFIEGYVHSRWSTLRIVQLGGEETSGSNLIGLSCTVDGCWTVGAVGIGRNTQYGVAFFFSRFNS
jgi:hypothetical protein